MMSHLGEHILADYWQCNELSAETWADAIREAVEAAGATLLDLRCCCFQPQGVTAVALLAESHLAVHTWPQHGYVAVDLFTCGDRLAPRAALAVLERYLEPASKRIQPVRRGLFEEAVFGSPAPPGRKP